MCRNDWRVIIGRIAGHIGQKRVVRSGMGSVKGGRSRRGNGYGTG